MHQYHREYPRASSIETVETRPRYPQQMDRGHSPIDASWKTRFRSTDALKENPNDHGLRSMRMYLGQSNVDSIPDSSEQRLNGFAARIENMRQTLEAQQEHESIKQRHSKDIKRENDAMKQRQTEQTLFAELRAKDEAKLTMQKCKVKEEEMKLMEMQQAMEQRQEMERQEMEQERYRLEHEKLQKEQKEKKIERAILRQKHELMKQERIRMEKQWSLEAEYP